MAVASTQPAGIDVREQRPLLTGLLCAALVVCCWTAFLLISRHGARGTFTPYDLVALRFGVSGLVMLPFLLRRGFAGLRLGQVVLLVLTAGPVFALFSFIGFAYAPASHAAILMPGLLPLWAALLAFLVLGHRLRTAQLICLGLILSGVAALGWTSFTDAPPGAWIGDLIFPLAPLAWAVFTVCCRLWQVPALQATAIVATGSMVIYLPVYLLLLPKGLADTPMAEIVGQALFQGIIAVVVALWAFTRAVEILGPATTTMLTAAVPGLAALLAVPLLGEPLTPGAGVGVALVTLGMAGTVIALRRPERRP